MRMVGLLRQYVCIVNMVVFSAALWVCVVLAPHCGSMEKQRWQKTLEQWAQTDVCPLEDPDHRHQDNNDRVGTYTHTNIHHISYISMDMQQEVVSKFSVFAIVR